MIPAYFDQLKRVVDGYAAATFVLDAQINFEFRPGNQGYVVGAVLFRDESTLHFREYVDAEEGAVSRLTYSYHYQDADAQLVLRYDNARHRPALTALEHKHTGDTAEVSQAPTLEAVLNEIVTGRAWV